MQIKQSGPSWKDLLEQLPDFHPHWGNDVKVAWFAAYATIVVAIIQNQALLSDDEDVGGGAGQ